MNESELGWLDFSHDELGAALLEELERVRANVAAKAAELSAHKGNPYIALDDRDSQEGRLAAELTRLQDDQIAIGQVLEVARRQRATAGVGR